jgi:hypothetical protein
MFAPSLSHAASACKKNNRRARYFSLDARNAACDKAKPMEDPMSLQKFDVLNRLTRAVQFTAEIDCDDKAPRSIKRGLAVRWGDSRGADLTRANLTGADLTGADLTRADLTRANLTGADLTGADLSGAKLTGAKLSGVTIPVVPKIDVAILAAIESAPGVQRLDMLEWHMCETTHCRAGWAIHLAGEPGYALEKAVGPAAAGGLIYAASRPGVRVPDFYATNDAAMADIRACAAEQLGETT